MKSIVIYFSRGGFNYVNGEIKDLNIQKIIQNVLKRQNKIKE